MKYQIFGCIILFTLLVDCQSSKVLYSDKEENNFSELEIETLSNDCEYVILQVTTGLKKWIKPKQLKENKRIEKIRNKDWIKVMTIAHGPSWAKEYKQKQRENKKNSRKKNTKNDKKKETDEKIVEPLEIPVFFRNDFLVSLVKMTSCFDGYNEDQIIGLFGESPLHCLKENCLRSSLEYHFVKEENSIDYLIFNFENHQLVSKIIMPVKRIYSH